MVGGLGQDRRTLGTTATTAPANPFTEPEGPKISAAFIPLELLDQLEDHQNRLNAYVKAYLSCRDLMDVCVRIRSNLDLGRREEERLKDSLYWQVIRDLLEIAHNSCRAAPSALKPEHKEMARSIKNKLREVIERTERVMIAPNSADVINIIGEVQVQTYAVIGDITGFAQETKQATEDVLPELEDVVRSITKEKKVSGVAQGSEAQPRPNAPEVFAARKREATPSKTGGGVL